MIQRWKMSPNQSMVTEPDGEYVEYDDHLAAIEERDREIFTLRRLLREAEVKFLESSYKDGVIKPVNLMKRIKAALES